MTADSSFSYIDASVSEKEGSPYPERGFKLLLNGLECQMKQDYIGTGHHFRSLLITTKYNTKLTCNIVPEIVNFSLFPHVAKHKEGEETKCLINR